MMLIGIVPLLSTMFYLINPSSNTSNLFDVFNIFLISNAINNNDPLNKKPIIVILLTTISSRSIPFFFSMNLNRFFNSSAR